MVRAMRGSDIALWSWFALGVLACTCIPALRARDPLWGWLPFWLIVAPLLDLAVLHRVRLAATSRTFLVRLGRRRRPAAQARRQIRRHAVRWPASAVTPQAQA